MSDDGKKPGDRHSTRVGKTMIGAYVDKTDLYTIQELLLRLTRERGSGEKLTMQQFIIDALRAELAKHGIKLSRRTLAS
jgi:hypothetical protein